MRFLHTADWQIGMKAAHAGAASTRVREARIESASRVVDVARNENAEFLLLAGDTFESNDIDRAAIQKIGDILATFGRPVYVLPGNHDPLEIGSVWEHDVWKSHANVHVLREACPIPLSSGFLYPCPVLSTRSKNDLTAWIPVEHSGAIRIGVAHGTVEGNPAIEPSLPIPRDAVTRTRVDFLALGHWHSTATYQDENGATRMAYSGTHDATRFRERDSGNVLLVDIAEPGAFPEIRTIPTGSLRWQSTELTLIEPGQLIELRKKVEAAPGGQSTLIEVCLKGILFANEGAEISRLEQILSSRFLHAHVDTSCLVPSPADEDWVSPLTPGFLRTSAAKLREIANSDSDAKRRIVAMRALRELYTLKHEVPA
jgi:DNA repair exonuclease SbcCD nuclease subunit